MHSPDNFPTKQYKSAPIDREKWATIIAEWEKSEESQKDFCKRLNLNINTFSYARSMMQIKEKSNKSKFVPVRIKQDALPMHSFEKMILENNRGIKIHLPVMVSEERLLMLLKILEA